VRHAALFRRIAGLVIVAGLLSSDYFFFFFSFLVSRFSLTVISQQELRKPVISLILSKICGLVLRLRPLS
jgi:hypothetical protein